MQSLWLRFLTEIDCDGSDEVSQDLLDNPQTGQALEIVRESGLNDAERAAYEGFWDRVSIEATKKCYIAEAEAKLGETKAQLGETKAKLGAAVAERDAEKARADAAEARADTAAAERDMERARADAVAVERDAAREKLRQSAHQMKADGLSVETVAKYTGLSAAEIAAL